MQRISIDAFFKRYPEIKPKSQAYKNIRFGEGERARVLAEVEYINDESITHFMKKRGIYSTTGKLIKSYTRNLDEFLDHFNFIFSKNEELALKSFACFLYEIAHYPDDYVMNEIKTLRELAKSLGINRMIKFSSNTLFLRTPTGLDYSEYYKKAKAAIDALFFIKEIIKALSENEKERLLFYELRLKAPLDVYEKLLAHRLNSDSIFDLHDLLGLRLIYEEKVDRKQQMRKIENTLLNFINVYKMLKLNEKPLTTKTGEGIKRYYEEPKENGYNRLHVLTIIEGFSMPLEIQVDTHKNYGKIENNPYSMHGVQKPFLDVSPLNNERCSLLISIGEKNGEKKEHRLYPLKDRDHILSVIKYLLKNKGMAEEKIKEILYKLMVTLHSYLEKKIEEIRLEIGRKENKEEIRVSVK